MNRKNASFFFSPNLLFKEACFLHLSGRMEDKKEVYLYKLTHRDRFFS